jgi:microcystin-dependent protein
MANYTKATNFTAKDGLPTGNSNKVVKGAEIDTEYTAIASAIASKADINSQTLTGTPAAPTASTGTNTTQIATTAFVNASILYAVPAGVITMWAGSIASIPTGWSLCNGSSGTPDLRDRFVVGAGIAYSVGATGGAGSVTLDATMLPAHTHTVSASGTTSGHSSDHTHSGTTSTVSTDHTHIFSGTTGTDFPDHVHYTHGPYGGGGNPGGSLNTGWPGGQDYATSGASTRHNHNFSGTTSGMSANHTHTVTTGGVSTNHTHTVTVTGTTNNGTGGGLAHENRPPYFALAYIMKL